MPAITIYCSTCGRRKLINPSCGKRNCKRCQFKRARKLERKYLPAIIEKQNKPGHMWTFVNLTCIHFTVETDSLCSILRRLEMQCKNSCPKNMKKKVLQLQKIPKLSKQSLWTSYSRRMLQITAWADLQPSLRSNRSCRFTATHYVMEVSKTRRVLRKDGVLLLSRQGC